MTKSEKNHDTGLRVLEVLKILLENEVAKKELIVKIKTNNQVESVYSYEAFLKYFNTLEFCGFNFDKDKNKYKLINALTKADLSKAEEKMLLKIVSDINSLNNKSKEEKLEMFFEKLDKYVDVDLHSKIEQVKEKESFIYDANVKKNIVASLKNMIFENHDVDLTYKKNNEIIENSEIVLKEITEKDGKIFLVFYNPKKGRNKKINIDSIISVKQSPKKAPEKTYLNSVVFEVYGRLVHSYKLRKEEQALNFSNNHITVSNRGEDKDTLLLRLLKYGENCKIIRPKDIQEEFIALTDKMLKNLEG